MNARNKLNVAYVNGCLLIAIFVGAAAGSWHAFLLAAAALAAAGVAKGDIRLRPRGR
ncbi:hypothetical protein [Paludisphaera mucosa]|uniref:Uncharacterized protein n=1 Tax=Paludisphaera mucosa TaxID=3030827 RepID=A0ABT6FEC3_9BACT|nr:hypothetical protein [Paludisphaera mucosa]MDG3005933.1 hypothetical protein [Paludisphaera mucosa]